MNIHVYIINVNVYIYIYYHNVCIDYVLSTLMVDVSINYYQMDPKHSQMGAQGAGWLRCCRLP